MSQNSVISQEGKPYALLHFQTVGSLSSEEADRAKRYGQQFREIVSATQLVQELTEAG